MIQFIIGAALMAAGIGIIFAVRSPEDRHRPRDAHATPQEVLLSILVLILIMVGGTLVTLGLV